MSSDPLIGRVIAGRYRVVRALASGGMGAVYVAVQESLEREVALKIIRGDRVDARFRARFDVEAKAMSALRDPHVVTVIDFGIDGDLPFLAMELLEGTDLADLLRAHQRLPWRRAAGVLRDVAIALVAAERAGVMHRDLKPSNVFLIDGASGNDFVKVLDFGIAKLADGRADDGRPHTETGAIAGTAGYMAPERMLGRGDDPRSDLYAVGVMAWDMIAGASPFPSGEPLQVAMRHLQEPAPRLSTKVEVPPALDELVLRLLAKSAPERPRAADVVATLDAILSDRASAQSPSSPSLSPRTETMDAPMPAPPRARRALYLAAGAVALVGAVVVGVVSARPANGPQAMKRPAMRRLTFVPGVEREPTLSPSGDIVVYAAPGKGGLDDLFALDLTPSGAAAGPPRALTSTEHAIESAPAFSADGSQLAWGVRDEHEDAVWLGGPRGERPRRIASDVYAPSFSPDGSKLAVSTATFDEPERVSLASEADIVVIDIATGARRVVASGSPSFQPSWSARGHIAYWAVDATGRRDLWTVPAAGGTPTPITADVAVDFQPRFAADGRALHFLSDRGGAMALWAVAIDTDGAAAAPPVQVFGGGVALRAAAFNGERVVYRSGASVTRLERRVLDATAHTVGPATLVTETPKELASIDLSPSGAWLVAEAVAEHSDLLLMSVDGRQERALTHDDALDRSPRFVREDLVAFASNRGGRWGIWLIDITKADGAPTALPAAPCPAVAPLPSPSGGLVAFQLGCEEALVSYAAVASPTPPRAVRVAAGPAVLPLAWRGSRVVVNRPGERYDIVDLDTAAVVESHAVALGAFAALDDARLIGFQERGLVVVEGSAVMPLEELGTGAHQVPLVIPSDVSSPAFALSADRRAIFLSGRQEQSDLWLAQPGPEPR